MCKVASHPSVALRVTQAYVRLFFARETENGSRTISLARFGNYEIRLVELLSIAGDPPLWMELYAHDVQRTIDSCSCCDLEDAVCAAELLLPQARQLSESAELGRMKGDIE